MRLVINLLLIAFIAGLVYVLIGSISEPIKFKAELQRREDAVTKKLRTIRTTQELYRDITEKFAPNFDTLKQVLTNGRFAIVQVYGDPDDPNNAEAIRYDTLFTPAIDSIRKLGINLDSLEYIPFTNGEKFQIKADTMTYQSTLVSVVEVGTKRSNFMGKYGNPKYAKYDSSYDPNSFIKFGDMNKPNLSGNWE